MDRFEETIRRAKPEVPPLPADFAAQVWAEAQRQGLRVRPAWQVRGPLWVGRAAAVVALLAAMVVLDGAAYQVRSSGLLELLHFGATLLGSFAAHIPYDLVLTALVLGAAAAWLARYARLLRVPIAWAILISYGITGAGGLALAGSGLNESLQTAVIKDEVSGPGLSWFFERRAVYRRPDPRFRMGRVIALDGQRARLRTPLGDEEQVVLPPDFHVRVGDDVRLLAKPNGALMHARMAQHCNPATVRGYFRHHEMMREMMRARGMGPGMRGHGPGMQRGMRGMGPGMGGPGMGMGPGMRGMGGPDMGMGSGMHGMGMGPR